LREPEVALAFTADPWVEELHRHLTDHGGARVRTLLVEPEGAIEESYDVLVAGHRWPALTRALVADVHAHGRTIVGVHDREEHASRDHLVALGVDALVESDAAADAFVRAIVGVAGRRDELSTARPIIVASRIGRFVAVGGPPGVGRTEIAIQLTCALGRRARAVLVDADDVAPAVAPRLHLPIEPNLRTAIDAVEHGRGELEPCVLVEPMSHVRVIGGLPNASAWAQVRPGEILRVVDRLSDDNDVVVADGAGMLDDVGVGSGGTRGRFATARILVGEADVVVAVCDPSPHGVGRLLGWLVEAHSLAPSASVVVVANRAPGERFRRGELYDEITKSVPTVDVVFVGGDRRVGDAAWNGTVVRRGAFTRAIDEIAERVLAQPRRAPELVALEAAS
jgi:MinD-like ATPase involved in chromosome partitioning or flagellar assembly